MDNNEIINKLKITYNEKSSQTLIPGLSPQLNKLIKENNLRYDSEKSIIILNKENVSKVKHLINRDDDCFQFSKIIYFAFGKRKVKRNYSRALFTLIREIDRDSCTNVWKYISDEYDFYKVVDYITYEETYFFKRLKRGDISLPDEIVSLGGNRYKSLSVKICKLLSSYMFDKDYYYDFDSCVKHILPFYLDYYNVEKRLEDNTLITNSYQIEKISYKDFHFLLEKLNRVVNRLYHTKIGKSEITSLLWYCYKSYQY